MTSTLRRCAVAVICGAVAVGCGGDDGSQAPSVSSDPPPVSSDPPPVSSDPPSVSTATTSPLPPADSTAPEPPVPDTSVEPVDDSPETSAALPAPSEESEALFDQAVLHEVSMEISDSDLGLLAAATDERVPVILTVDGETAVGAGVRLKGNSQFQSLDKKPAFSIETDEFVDGLELFDVDRFTLGNATWDHSFVAEQLVYELAREAGIPAARTALARVTVNGEPFGIYVMRETYDERWLEQYFTDAGGNLYESPGGGPDTVLELRTNKRREDTSDIAAVAEVVATASDDDYRAAIEELVDVQELLTYWAVEALTAHWDGYAYDLRPCPPTAGRPCVPGLADADSPPANPYPNNFYAYHDPETGRFVIIPHGADLSFGLAAGFTYDVAPTTPVLIPPKVDATVAMRLWADRTFRDELAERIRWVLDEVWDVDALTRRVDQLADLVRADGLTGAREFITMAQFEEAVADREDFLTRRPEAVRAELDAWQSGAVSNEGD